MTLVLGNQFSNSAALAPHIKRFQEGVIAERANPEVLKPRAALMALNVILAGLLEDDVNPDTLEDHAKLWALSRAGHAAFATGLTTPNAGLFGQKPTADNQTAIAERLRIDCSNLISNLQQTGLMGLIMDVYSERSLTENFTTSLMLAASTRAEKPERFLGHTGDAFNFLHHSHTGLETNEI